jgi:L-malate glycosyltransferase
VKVIVHVDNSSVVTGALKALTMLCEQMPEYRHVIVLPSEAMGPAQLLGRFKIYQLPFVELSKSVTSVVKYLPVFIANAIRLRRIIRSEHASLLHVNDVYNLVGYFSRLGLNVPIVVHARMLPASFPNLIYRCWSQWHLWFADAIVAVSKAVRREWGNHRRVVVVYDATPPAELHEPYNFAPPGSDEPFRFVYLANYIPGKGQDDALRAAAAAARARSRLFTIDFVGAAVTAKSAGYVESLRKEAEQLGLSERVRFLGATSDVEATLKQYHAMLHLSHAESFGMACYEACCYGIPVISSACGGPEEIIDADKTGLLVPVCDTVACARAMLRLMDEDGLAARISSDARAVTGCKFAAQGSMVDVFEQLTRGRRCESNSTPPSGAV